MRHINKGELLFTEAPLFSVNREFSFPLGMAETTVRRRARHLLVSELADALTRAGTAQRATFDALSCSSADCKRDGGRTAIGIFKTNAFETGSSGSIFALCSRINHSCRPNVRHDWDPRFGGALRLRAARNIAVGDEITIAYNAQALPREERRAVLERDFGFLCECELCR
jgi:hypothetical protein